MNWINRDCQDYIKSRYSWSIRIILVQSFLNWQDTTEISVFISVHPWLKLIFTLKFDIECSTLDIQQPIQLRIQKRDYFQLSLALQDFFKKLGIAKPPRPT